MSERQYRQILDVAYQLGSVRGPEALTRAALELLVPLMGADVAALNQIDIGTGEALLTYHPRPTWHAECMEVLSHLGAEHPLVRHYTGGGLPALRPVRISDLVTMRDWYRSRTYRELFVLIGARHQLALPLCTGDGGVIGYAFNRSGADFGGSEVGLASWLQPTLAALHVAATATRAPDDLIGAARERAGLTPREYEVLTLLAEGMTARAIGRALCVSERTINRHVSHVYDKLGYRDRLSAVQHARRAGLLP